MKISVVTVVLNDKEGLEETLRSVFSQECIDVESIVIDGASTDGTVDVINRYVDKISYWSSEPDKGIYDAMNKGIIKATGEWLCFMNAKDKFADSEVLSRLMPYFKSCADVIVGNTLMENDGKIKEFKARKNRNISSCYATSMGFMHQSSFVRTKLARKYKFDVNYRLASDFKMMYNIHKDGGQFIYVDFPISYFDNSGVSSNHCYLGKFETFSIIRPSQPFINKILAFVITLVLKIRNRCFV